MGVLTRNVAVGEEFTGKPKRISWQRLWAFSGGPFNNQGWPRKNIHTDLEFARGVGLATVAASGTQPKGHICELLVDLFGEAWLSSGWITVKFIKVIPENDILHAKAKVTSVEQAPDQTKVELEVWCENQEGEKSVVGTAKGVIA